ncbi:MAG: glucosaminidase domain-containing protein [Deltaproteobacteria bacterium]|jgi:uncharacterized FlgJ-related protein|nr:glucosaminidase domain-containing protein [Deltaproteobacteria bacterium]
MKTTAHFILMATAMAGFLSFLVSCKNIEQVASSTLNEELNNQIERVTFSSEAQLDQVFSELNFKPNEWLSGNRKLPRLFLTDIPLRWRDVCSKGLDTVTKKQVFFLFLSPLVLHANDQIQAKRDRIASIINRQRAGSSISAEDQTFLKATAMAYKVIAEDTELTSQKLQDRLLRRVDTLPPSLVLAQAAEESGWGTSRFAVEGNALFGMWTWGGDGIKPFNQRPGLGNYKIAVYETLLESVIAYMHNLNTHPAYKMLRAQRAKMRKIGAKVNGWDLAKTLTKYSERGQAYVNSLKSLIEVNRLHQVDDSYLSAGPTILLIPVGEETDRLASR